MRRVIPSVLAALSVVLALALLGACGGDGGSLRDSAASPQDAASSPAPSAPPLIGGPTQADLPMTVAVTVPIVADFVREIGGENVKVVALLPSGADPHTHRFTQEDVQRIQEVDFFFVNGLGLDTELSAFIEENRREDAKVIPFAPNVASPRGSEPGEESITADEAGDNPHLWLDPVLARVYAEIVADTFVIYDGINRSFYNENFLAYKEQIAQFDEEVRGRINTIPEERRKLVTFHDSFDLFASRYGLTVEGFLVSDPGEEPGAEEIARLADVVTDQGVPAVFAENGFDAGPMREVAADAGVRVCTLFSDVPGDESESYLQMMSRNVDELLGCLGEGADGG